MKINEIKIVYDSNELDSEVGYTRRCRNIALMIAIILAGFCIWNREKYIDINECEVIYIVALVGSIIWFIWLGVCLEAYRICQQHQTLIKSIEAGAKVIKTKLDNKTLYLDIEYANHMLKKEEFVINIIMMYSTAIDVPELNLNSRELTVVEKLKLDHTNSGNP